MLAFFRRVPCREVAEIEEELLKAGGHWLARSLSEARLNKTSKCLRKFLEKLESPCTVGGPGAP